MSQFTIAVCGRKQFKDRKFVERTLNSVHARYRITTLITGNLPGVEEMAYWWGVQKPIPVVVTLPYTGFAALDATERYRRMFTEYHANGVVVFGKSAFIGWLDEAIAKYKVKVWSVQLT